MEIPLALNIAVNVWRGVVKTDEWDGNAKRPSVLVILAEALRVSSDAPGTCPHLLCHFEIIYLYTIITHT